MFKQASIDRYLDDYLPGFIDAIDARPDEASIRSSLAALASNAGFSCFAYLSMRGAEIVGYSSYPEEWQRRYLKGAYASIDPVISQARRTMRPTAWSVDDRVHLDEAGKRFFAEAAEFGIVSGMAVPIRGSFGRVALLAFASDKIIASAIGVRDVAYAATAVTAVHINIQRLAQKAVLAAEALLSPREQTCLMWASLGKTHSEIASVLGISKKTVRFYLESARNKLGAGNTTHAVRIATERGML